MPARGSRRRTWVFSGRLRHSRRAYREVVFDQKQETFFACHMHAFEWFGGVPEKVTPDNLKAAVIVASFEDPLVNRAYRELALHYGFLISPCLPRRPEHKGGVEGISSTSSATSCRCSARPRRSAGATPPTPANWLRNWSAGTVRAAISMSSRRSVALLELFESEASYRCARTSPHDLPLATVLTVITALHHRPLKSPRRQVCNKPDPLSTTGASRISC